MPEQVTSMILKIRVDLQCSCCYKKVKKVLCKFPQIRDQEYDEKQNLVKIKVVCCDPEKIRDKLCCKGGKVIKSIEIVEPRKEKQNDKKKQPPPPEDDKKKQPPPPEDDKKKQPPPPEEKPKPFPAVYFCVLCWERYGGGPCYCGYGRPVLPPPCYHNYGCRCAYGYGKGCYVSRCDYFSEENTGACNIM